MSRIKPIEFGNVGLKMLIYGKSGSGKTTFCATFPGPILWIVCSGGQQPGELRSINTPEIKKKVSQVVIESTEEIKELVEHVKSGGGNYSTLVLDHASGLQDLTLKEILGLEELPPQKTWGLARQQDYGQSSLICKEIFRALLGLSCNVLLVAQERVFGEESESELITPTVGAALTPSVTGWLNPACDYVVQTYLRPKMKAVKTVIAGKTITTKKRASGIEYCLRTEPHDVYMTKFRVPKGTPLLECLVDPSYEKVLDLINASE